MIVTLTLNAALDITYHVDSLVENGTHRVRHVHNRAGGKGVNVARVLDTFGYPVVATGFAGGTTGTAIRDDLTATGIVDRFVDIAADSRRTVAVVAESTGEASVFNEPGPEVTDREWRCLLAGVDELLDEASMLICSGSLPPSLSRDAYAQVCHKAHARGVPVVVDAYGPALTAALAEGPLLVKPNLDELLLTTGATNPAAGATMLRSLGAQSVVASLGPDGLVAVTDAGAWQARPRERLRGNPTGAGDACVAALAAGAVRDEPWPDRLRHAVAWAAAAVRSPYAGDVDPATAEGLYAQSTIEEIHDAHTHG